MCQGVDAQLFLHYYSGMDVKEQVEQRIRQAGGVMQLAKKAGIQRQTIYNLRRGGSPTFKTAALLGLRVPTVGK